jgi:hypothetical protein
MAAALHIDPLFTGGFFYPSHHKYASRLKRAFTVLSLAVKNNFFRKEKIYANDSM